MGEQKRGFRGALFGGFKRADVLNYIQETDQNFHNETEELRRQLAEAQAALAGLREENEGLAAKNAGLLERLGEMTMDADKIRTQLDEVEKGFTLQTEEIEAQNARAEALAGENSRLAEENARLAAKCGEYDATREKLAEMELAAYRRAKQIEEEAKIEQRKIRDRSVEMVNEVKRQLDTAKENCRTLMARSQQESAEVARRTGEVLSEIDRISATLGREGAEKSKSGLRDVLNGLRPKAEE